MSRKNKKKCSDRITDERNFEYNGKVLLGNWVEERSEYRRMIQPWCTLYDVDYSKRQNNFDREEFWQNRYKGNGIPIHKLFGQGDSEDYYKNQSTVYDLAYHHKFRDLFGKSHGIQTKTGLKEYKESEWSDDKHGNRYKTTNNAFYHEYPKECLQVKHRKGHDCDEYIKDPTDPKSKKCVQYKRVPLKILPI